MATLARLNVTLGLQADAFERGVRQAQAAAQRLERGLATMANRASTAVNGVGRTTTTVARTIERGLSSATQAASRAASEMARSLDRAGERLSSFGTKATIAAGAVVAAFGLMARAALAHAIEAVESESLFEVSLGRQAEAVREWSEQVEEALGLSARATRRQVGTFTAMFKGMEIGEQSAVDMAKGLVLLANDMASFFNLQPEEAFEKLQAAISGETEPLRRLGIVVNETTVRMTALRHGLIGANEEMSESQKVVARYLTILEQTALAQGDLARTIDSPANQLRIAQARFNEITTDIGTKFLPTLATALTWLNNEGLPRVSAAVDTFSERWGALSDEARRRILFIAGLLVAGGPLLKALGVAIQAFDRFARFVTSRLGLIAVAVVGVGALVFEVFGQQIAEMIASAGLQLQEMGIRMQRDATKPLGRALKVMGIDLQEAGEGLMSFGRGMVRFGDDMATLRERISPVQEFGKLLSGDFSGLEKLAGVAIPALDAALASLEDVGLDQLQKLVDEIDKEIGFDRVTNAAKQGKDALVNALKPPADVRKLWEEAAKGIVDAGKAAKGAREMVSKLSEALSDARRRLQELSRPVLRGMTEIEDTLFFAELERDRRRLARIGRRFGIRVPEIMTEEGRQIIASLPRGTAALNRFIEAKELELRVRFAEQQRLLQAAANGVPQEMTFEEALRAIALTKAEIASLEPQIAAAKAAADAQATAANAQTVAAIEQRDAAKSLNTAADALTRALQTGEARLQLGPRVLGAITSRARGGPLAAGQLALVGEEGPELFASRSGGTILPNETLRALASGHGDTINITIEPNGIVVHGGDSAAGRDLGRRIVEAIVGAVQGAGAPARRSLPGAVGG